jgi:hypothetical protein
MRTLFSKKKVVCIHKTSNVTSLVTLLVPVGMLVHRQSCADSQQYPDQDLRMLVT